MVKEELPVRYPAKALVVDTRTRKVLILQLEGKERAMRGIDEWHIPGGSFEDELDNDLEETAIREVKEEVGLRVEIKKKLGEASWDAYYESVPTHFKATFFLAELQQDPNEAIMDKSEVDAMAWVDEESMSGYPALTPEAKKFVPMALKEYPR